MSNTAKISPFSYLKRDALAGTVTGLMAIPLSVGICLMSDYPVQTGLVTVTAACLISFIMYWLKPGNHVGVPGIAAGLAPALAMGVHTFGIANMPFLIFLTALIQAIVWQFNLQKYILQLVPNYLVEGLLAGIGLKIALKFLPFTYLTAGDHDHAHLVLDTDHELVVGLSIASFVLFLYLYNRYRKTSPGLPYIITIALGIICTQVFTLPKLNLTPVPFRLALPLPQVSALTVEQGFRMVGFALMLATIDVIEQVMSNAAIEKIDPLGRPCNTNNSLLTIWIANLTSSFFGGMTNLDGLAKSTTNAVAGAVTKFSNLFTALVVGTMVAFPALINYLPEFSLGVIMIFSGWKMIVGLNHVIKEGQYPFILAIFCGVLVFQLGIFEGLLLAMLLHAIISYLFLRHDDVSAVEMWTRLKARFGTDEHALVKSMDAFVRREEISPYPVSQHPVIHDWIDNINHHRLEGIINLYADDAVLLPTLSDEIRNSREAIKDYFVHFFQREDLHVDLLNCMVKDEGTIRLNMGEYAFSWLDGGQTQQVKARYTFAIRNDKIIGHHSSLMPA